MSVWLAKRGRISKGWFALVNLLGLPIIPKIFATLSRTEVS